LKGLFFLFLLELCVSLPKFAANKQTNIELTMMSITRIFALSVIALIGQHAMAADLTERTMPATPDFYPNNPNN